MFTELYLHTSNPKLRFSQLFQPYIFFPIIISVLFHTTVYTLFCNMVSYIFFDKILSYKVNQKLVFFLLLIMFFGFGARFLYVKDIYKAFHGNMKAARKHIDNSYLTWIFIS